MCSKDLLRFPSGDEVTNLLLELDSNTKQDLTCEKDPAGQGFQAFLWDSIQLLYFSQTCCRQRRCNYGGKDFLRKGSIRGTGFPLKTQNPLAGPTDTTH
ncbi:hypothetical protein UPYG_G00313770 [Umbra pygmaea]|uniref:Uncharacterized protein n=1 Tax=Umbra pygmaea TaxID=75934 RepID=A0ABD0WJD0_UMBPY